MTIKPRIIVVVVQTHVTQGLYRKILSANLSNVEIVTIAMGGLYSHVKRPRWVMEFLERHNSSDEDIVITVDGSDVRVSDGEKYENAVKYFIENTAENEEKFSENYIVKEKQISPIIFMSTAEYYFPQLNLIMNSDYKEHVQRCFWFLKALYSGKEKLNLTHLLKWWITKKPSLSSCGIIASVEIQKVLESV